MFEFESSMHFVFMSHKLWMSAMIIVCVPRHRWHHLPHIKSLIQMCSSMWAHVCCYVCLCGRHMCVCLCMCMHMAMCVCVLSGHQMDLVVCGWQRQSGQMTFSGKSLLVFSPAPVTVLALHCMGSIAPLSPHLLSSIAPLFPSSHLLSSMILHIALLFCTFLHRLHSSFTSYSINIF